MIPQTAQTPPESSQFDSLLTICLRINNRCHFKCFHCQSRSEVQGCTDHDLAPILEVLTSFTPLRIFWCGGETTLSPRLKEYVAWSVDQGWVTIVNSNMAAGDPLGQLAGRFFYQVGIHGTDAPSFKNHTGWNLFEDFKTNCTRLFEVGHRVGASITIKGDWRDYLEKDLRWLAQYPLERVLISNAVEAGSNLFGFHAIDNREIAEMKSIVNACSPRFPVVFPLFESDPSDAILVIDPVPNGPCFAKVNGKNLQNRDDFRQMLENIGPSNVDRYNRQDYYAPVGYHSPLPF